MPKISDYMDRKSNQPRWLRRLHGHASYALAPKPRILPATCYPTPRGTRASIPGGARRKLAREAQA